MILIIHFHKTSGTSLVNMKVVIAIGYQIIIVMQKTIWKCHIIIDKEENHEKKKKKKWKEKKYRRSLIGSPTVEFIAMEKNALQINMSFNQSITWKRELQYVLPNLMKMIQQQGCWYKAWIGNNNKSLSI